MTSLHPDQALAYRGEAYLFFYPLLLGTSVSIPQMSFDVIFGHLCGLTNFPFEAYAGDVIYDYLTNAEYGVPGYTTDLVETPTLFNTFCGANSLLVSPVVTDQVEGSSFISDLLEATHAAIFMSGGVLRIRPYAEADASANGVTFTHDATPIYDLEPQDFLPGPNGTDPIDINRKQPQDISNNLRIEYLDRDNSYAPTVYETRDEASITAYGIERSSDVRNQHFFCRKECASVAAALQLQREQVTTTYTFNLPREFELLDPMDLLTLPLDKYGKGQARQPVRIIEIVERDDYSFTITAEEYLGTADMPTYSRQDTTHNLPDFNKAAPSVNTPVIFELPTLISGDLKVYTGLSGADPDNWGGAEIWASFDDVHYIKVDTVYGSSRMGVTESTLPDKAPAAPPAINIDTALINVTPAIAAAASGPARDTALINVSPAIAAVPIGPYRVTSLISAHPAIAAAVATAWNPSVKDSRISLSGGNLTASLPSALTGGDTTVNVLATLSGIANRYCEIKFTALTTGGSSGSGIGLANASALLNDYPGHNTNSSGYFYNGFYRTIHSLEQGTTTPWGVNDILGILLLASTAKFFVNGSLVITFSQIPSGPLFPVAAFSQSGDTCVANFGQSPFAFLPYGRRSVERLRCRRSHGIRLTKTPI
jgi:hypothetical protein